MKYPTLEEVDKASHLQLGRWYRHLPSPGFTSAGREDFEREQLKETKIMGRIIERFNDCGGWTVGLSKKVGF